MIRSLAVDFAKDNISVNYIAPGRFQTKMPDSVYCMGVDFLGSSIGEKFTLSVT